jgi:hypothetical protein
MTSFKEILFFINYNKLKSCVKGVVSMGLSSRIFLITSVAISFTARRQSLLAPDKLRKA